MHPFFQNKFVRFAGIGLAVILGLIIFSALTNTLSMSTGLSQSDDKMYTPSISLNSLDGGMMQEASYERIDSASSYYPPSPVPGIWQ